MRDNLGKTKNCRKKSNSKKGVAKLPGHCFILQLFLFLFLIGISELNLDSPWLS